MSGKISDVINYLYLNFYFGMCIVAALLVFLCVGMLFALFIAESISINEYTMSLLNLSFAIILAFITMIYVFLTKNTVDDQRKSRQIADIDKKLELFYQPLYFIFRNFDTVKLDKSDVLDVIENVTPYSYLASIKFEKSFEVFSSSVHSDFAKIRNEEDRSTIKYFVDDINHEIDELKKDRIKLIE